MKTDRTIILRAVIIFIKTIACALQTK